MLALPIFLLLGSNQNRKKRHRYIGFVVLKPDSEIDRERIKNTLKFYCKKHFGDKCRDVGLRLTRFNGKEGIVHCYHIYKDDVINLLSSIKGDIEIRTVGTSGTIKSLNRKFFDGRLKKKNDPDYIKRVTLKRGSRRL